MAEPANASDVAEITRAFAALAWPVVALVALLLFRTQLRALFARILRVELPGVRMELREELDAARDKASVAKESINVIVSGEAAGAQDEGHAEEPGEEGGPPVSPKPPTRPRGPTGPLPVDEIMEEATKSPKTALIALAVEIERRSREVLAAQGKPEATRAMGLRQQLRLIELSPPLMEAANEFQRIRNQIVHGQEASDADALRAIDIGLEILDALDQLPREVNYVVAPAVETFADEAGNVPHDFKAIVLRAYHPPSKKTEVRAFPIGRSDLKPGEPVTWEWNMRNIYPEAWYRDPETGSLAYGWTEAAEFAGRPIHRAVTFPRRDR